jgi:NAD(P)H-quinone oxidoreductase subunit L
MATLITYTILGGAYLIVIPALLMFYFKERWFKTGSWERVFICFAAFFFFPGLILLSPFLNFRPEPRKL